MIMSNKFLFGREYYYEKDNQNTNNLKEELLQTAAMCFRMYNNVKEF